MGVSQKLWLTGALGGPAKHLLSGDISRSAGLRLPAFVLWIQRPGWQPRVRNNSPARSLQKRKKKEKK